MDIKELKMRALNRADLEAKITATELEDKYVVSLTVEVEKPKLERSIHHCFCGNERQVGVAYCRLHLRQAQAAEQV